MVAQRTSSSGVMMFDIQEGMGRVEEECNKSYSIISSWCISSIDEDGGVDLDLEGYHMVASPLPKKRTPLSSTLYCKICGRKGWWRGSSAPRPSEI